MAQEYVRVVCNVYCRYEGLPPIYRVYINDELFTERTWIWNANLYLKEDIQIQAEPGDYNIRYELVPPNLAELIVGMPVVKDGNAEIIDNGKLRIQHATS
jgi:hypothetical protein